MKRLGVAGGGAWGTALAASASRGGMEVIVYAREAGLARRVMEEGENGMYLPGVELPRMEWTGDLGDLGGSEALLLTTASRYVRGTARGLRDLGVLGGYWVVCAKGLDVGEGGEVRLLSEAVEEEAGEGVEVGALSGAVFAGEAALGEFCAADVASGDGESAKRLAAGFRGGNLELRANADVAGTQIGGVMKNVAALACGYARGAGWGESACAALFELGFREMRMLCGALGGEEETLLGMSGLGDMVMCATSPTSRNMALGVRLGEGLAGEEGVLTEGAASAGLLARLGRGAGVEARLCETTARLVRGEGGAEDLALLLRGGA